MMTKLYLALGAAALVASLAGWAYIERQRAQLAEARVVSLEADLESLQIARRATDRAILARDQQLAALKRTKERTDAALQDALRQAPAWSDSPVPPAVARSLRRNPGTGSPEPSRAPAPGLPGV